MQAEKAPDEQASQVGSPRAATSLSEEEGSSLAALAVLVGPCALPSALRQVLEGELPSGGSLKERLRPSADARPRLASAKRRSPSISLAATRHTHHAHITS